MPDEIFYFRESDIPPTVEEIAPRVFEPLRRGLKDGLLVEIAYPGASGENAKRRIFPEVIFRAGETWYVSAFCHVREEPRTFRLDRISEANLTDVADTSHGIAQDIREHGIPWKREQADDRPIPDLPREPKLWIKFEIAKGENGPEFIMSGYFADPYPRDREAFSNDLIRHAEQGSIERMKEDIAAGADVNFRSGAGNTPFIAGASTCRMDVIRFLLEHGADPHQRTSHGISALHKVARCRNLEVVRYLVEELRLDVNAKDPLGWTPLYLAALNDCTETARCLLEHGADVNARTRDGSTPLMAAAKEILEDGQHSELVKLLLDAGAEVDPRDKDGRTALFYAIDANNTDGARRLLDAGASITHHDRNGVSPLLFALQNSQRLSNSGSNCFPRWQTGRIRFEELVRLLVKHGADLDTADKQGVTPLMMAHGNVLEYLLSQGACVGAFDCAGKTVAMYHISYPEELQLLRKYGADLTARDRDGNDLVLLAPLKYVVIKPLVVDLGLSVNTRNAKGNTILHRACKVSYLAMVKFLIRHGADPNIENNDGKTPEDLIYDRSPSDMYCDEDDEILKFLSRIHRKAVGLLWVACEAVDPEQIRHALTRGALPNENSSDGLEQTPMTVISKRYAAANSDVSDEQFRAAFDLLLSKGADPSCFDRDGNNPFCAAIIRKNEALFKECMGFFCRYTSGRAGSFLLDNFLNLINLAQQRYMSDHGRSASPVLAELAKRVAERRNHF